MTRRAAISVALLVLSLIACSTARPASAPATTTTTSATPTTADPLGPEGSTTTSSELPDVSADGFRTRARGVLTIGTERLIPPWYTGPIAGLTTGGFEYRLGQEIGARLGIPNVRVVPSSLVLMMTGQDCGCDLMIGGITITDSRARTLDLTEPYLDADQALLVRQGTSVTSLAGAGALRLATTVRDTSGVDAIRNRIKPTAAPVIVVDNDDAVRQLRDGRVDVVVLDTPDALALVHADPSLVVAGRLRTGDQYAVALALGSPNTALVNEVIRDMRNDGTIDNLVATYLGAQPGDVVVLSP